MTKLWVDPDAGWQYGFPKIWDTEKYPDQRVWLELSGWPPGKEIYYIRTWEAKDEKEFEVDAS